MWCLYTLVPTGNEATSSTVSSSKHLEVILTSMVPHPHPTLRQTLYQVHSKSIRQIYPLVLPLALTWTSATASNEPDYMHPGSITVHSPNSHKAFSFLILQNHFIIKKKIQRFQSSSYFFTIICVLMMQIKWTNTY